MVPKSNAKRQQNPRYNDLAIQRFNAEICILAGGSSKRMGRDKSRLTLGATTMLGHILKTAESTGLPVRVIRRDCIPPCGPLSGIYTALKTTQADAVLFLACDMPLVTTELVQFILHQVEQESRRRPATRHSQSRSVIFVQSSGRAGFPFLLSRDAVETVDRQIQRGDRSLQGLARSLRATILILTRIWSQQLFNVNNPKHLAAVKRLFQRKHGAISKPRVGVQSGRN